MNIWHNAFHEIVGENAGDIQDMLAANALSLRLLDAKWARYAGAVSANLANSIPQAMRVSRRVSASQLGIPLNKPADGKLMMTRKDVGSTNVGTMKITTIGPAPEDLTKLRHDWDKWLGNQANRATVRKIREEAGKDEDRLKTSFPPADAGRFLAALKVLGDRDAVTPPNLASLMFHVEEDDQTILLTGDGHTDDVVKGLEATGKLANEQGLHVNVLKVPHHGSEHNTTRTFPRRVTADHYVFCGNGFSENPDLDIVKLYLSSRLGKPSELSPNNEAEQPFHFWFSCTSDLVPNKYKPHMRQVEDLVRQAEADNSQKLTVHFLTDEPLVLALN
jgi:hypothetical protein